VQSKRSPLGIFPAQPVIFVMLQCLAIKVNAGALAFALIAEVFISYYYKSRVKFRRYTRIL
jgi:hypothetical protein